MPERRPPVDEATVAAQRRTLEAARRTTPTGAPVPVEIVVRTVPPAPKNR